jgi:uncharacterized protein YegL
MPSEVAEAGHNPEARLVTSLCVDVSSSMRGEPMKQLNQALTEYYAKINSDPLVAASAQVGITAFAGEVWSTPEFDNLTQGQRPPALDVLMKGILPRPLKDGTDFGAGVHEATNRLLEQVKKNREAGVPVYRPFLVIISDGKPTRRNYGKLTGQVQALEKAGKLLVFPVAVGPDADTATLSGFSCDPARPALPLKDYRAFSGLFNFLFASMRQWSQSTPGQQVSLPIELLTEFLRPLPPAPKPQPLNAARPGPSTPPPAPESGPTPAPTPQPVPPEAKGAIGENLEGWYRPVSTGMEA